MDYWTEMDPVEEYKGWEAKIATKDAEIAELKNALKYHRQRSAEFIEQQTAMITAMDRLKCENVALKEKVVDLELRLGLAEMENDSL